MGIALIKQFSRFYIFAGIQVDKELCLPWPPESETKTGGQVSVIYFCSNQRPLLSQFQHLGD